MDEHTENNMVMDIAKETRLSLGIAIDKLQSWIDSFIAHLPNMVVSIFIVILFIFLAKLAKRWVLKLFDPTKNDVIKDLSTNLVYYSVFGLGIIIILEILSLRTTVTSLLAGLGIIGIALGFAFQDIAANFLSGIILAYRKPFQIGDICQMGEFIGGISEINIRDTVLRTFQGQNVVIPNRSVIQNPIINYTSIGQRRIDLTFRAAFEEDLEQVKSITTKALYPLDFITRKEDINFVYTEFDHSAILFEIHFWIKYKTEMDYIKAKNNAIMAIKKNLDQHGISVPFTTRINRTISQ